MASNNYARQHPNITTLPALKKALKEFTEGYLHETFFWKTVEKWIEDILHKRIEDIVLCALGYEWDHNNRWVFSYRNSHDPPVGIVRTITDMATTLIENKLPDWLKEQESTLLAKITSTSTMRTVRKAYEEAFNEALYEKVQEWAKATAQTNVEKLFSEKNKEFFNELKLCNPLKLNDLRDMANDEGDNDA